MSDITPAYAIREHIVAADRHKIFSLLNATGRFLPREMAYGMDLFDEHLIKGDISAYRFILFEHGSDILAYGCFGAIRLSDRRFHLHWLAVDRHWQHHGIGSLLEAAIAEKIKTLGGVKVYAETSNRDYHRAARAFYEGLGYKPAGAIPDYYGDGDDMVLYCKDLISG